MPSLNAEGSLRPDIRWKLFSPIVLLSAVDLDAPENRLRKAAAPAGMALLLVVAICCPEDAIGWLSMVSLSSRSWRAPPNFLRLWRRIRISIIARIRAKPARLPTTDPTTVGVGAEPLSELLLLAGTSVTPGDACGVLVGATKPPPAGIVDDAVVGRGDDDTDVFEELDDDDEEDCEDEVEVEEVLFRLELELKLVDSIALDKVEFAYDVGTPLMMADAVPVAGADTGVAVVSSGLLTTSATVGTPDGHGNGGTAGTVKSLGNGGTGGTDGKTVAAATTAGAVDGVGGNVCNPSWFPLPSTVAITLTTTVTTLGSWRRWKIRCDSPISSRALRSRANNDPSTTLSSTGSSSFCSSRPLTVGTLGGESWVGRRRRR